MNMMTTNDGTKLYSKDWGTGQSVVFSHGWRLSADAWDAQVLFPGENAARHVHHSCVPGHCRSARFPNLKVQCKKTGARACLLVRSAPISERSHLCRIAGGDGTGKYAPENR
jgi:pimeloyl-ACP methyl ester carboxylesterase